MIGVLVATCIAYRAPLVVTDQAWVLKFNTIGTLHSPFGPIENPFLTGEVTLKRMKPTTSDSEVYRLKLKAKMDQTKLFEAFSTSFPLGADDEKKTNTTYRDDKYAYVVNSYLLNKPEAKIQSYQSDIDSLSEPILNPLAITIAITQRSLNSPELRKEFFLMEDGPRRYYATFRPNLNANTDGIKGEASYKFNLRMKDGTGDHPNFFSGAIRFNTITGKVQYIVATSEQADEPYGNDEMYSEVKGFSIRLDAKEEK